MRKSNLFGVLAIFAISALSIQTAEAQIPIKKKNTTEKVTDKKVTTADEAPATTIKVKPQAASEDAKVKDREDAPLSTANKKVEKKDDCCKSAEKCEKKSGDCCKAADASKKRKTRSSAVNI